jgi:hypothetical protein
LVQLSKIAAARIAFRRVAAAGAKLQATVANGEQ